ncbi:MAG: hypothetical protein PHW24_00775 [Candidatus Moranbacteria bacterium]|nr:hypothetical protein [Candidatus Moranbacteria bacterium]
MDCHHVLDYGDIKIVIFRWEVSICDVLKVAEEVYKLPHEELLSKVKIAASSRNGVPFVCLKNI